MLRFMGSQRVRQTLWKLDVMPTTSATACDPNIGSSFLEFTDALSHIQAPLGLHTFSCHMTGSLRETQRGILCLLMFSSFISLLSCHCTVKHIHKASATMNPQMEIRHHYILSRSVI